MMCFHPINTVNQDNQLLLQQPPASAITFYKGNDFFHIFVPTLSLVFRNCLRYFPEEFYQVRSTDAFIVAMLSGFGNGARLGFVGGCYRKHEGGLYNSLTTLEKYKQAIRTRKLMKRSPYFKKNNAARSAAN
ncbi:hypothetical protein [Paraflavitalea speifideaquila]|uniref:hypothetical protein n=1 Tax=Paraflavitalea speifideaquila TaxID=3076558 RepID=UPI0028E895DC|nr:hypothetical protein [Paraflavitalea speifideiaquila]